MTVDCPFRSNGFGILLLNVLPQEVIFILIAEQKLLKHSTTGMGHECVSGVAQANYSVLCWTKINSCTLHL